MTRVRDAGREVMAEYIGRDLLPHEIVHHRDGDRNNNHIDNLQLTDRAGHIRIHKPMIGYKFTEEQRSRLSDAHKGQIPWNKGKPGYKHSYEANRRKSATLKGRVITWGDKISKSKTKVTKEQLLEYLRRNPKSTLLELQCEFGLKTHMAIHRHGGIRRLRKEIL